MTTLGLRYRFDADFRQARMNYQLDYYWRNRDAINTLRKTHPLYEYAHADIYLNGLMYGPGSLLDKQSASEAGAALMECGFDLELVIRRPRANYLPCVCTHRIQPHRLPQWLEEYTREAASEKTPIAIYLARKIREQERLDHA